MSCTMGQNKGKRAEREVVKLLQPLVDHAYQQAGLHPERLQRTSHQAAAYGGADLVGMVFLAVEVKHRKSFSVPAWWRQTCEQMGNRLPILFYRRNHMEFRVRVVWAARFDGSPLVTIDDWTDIPLWAARVWVYQRLCEYLNVPRDLDFERELCE